MHPNGYTSKLLRILMFLLAALAMAACAGGEGKKATGACEADTECGGGVCFDTSCYTACTKQGDCQGDQVCARKVSTTGIGADLCVTAADFIACTVDADCAALVLKECEKVRCDLTDSLCKIGSAADCTGKECGDDGCGGSCGTCSDGTNCDSGQCIPDSTPKPLIELIPADVIDFGFVAQATTAERQVTIRNSGAADLEVSSVAVTNNPTGEYALVVNESFGPTASIPEPATIEPGGQVAVTVSFVNNGGSSGQQLATLGITSNDEATPTVEVGLQATRMASPVCSLTLSPPKLDFGMIAAGESKELAIQLTNTGSGNCTYESSWISDCATTLDGLPTSCVSDAAMPSSSYQIVGEPAKDIDGLAPGSSASLTVRYSPDGQAVSYPALLAVSYKESYSAGGEFTSHLVPANCFTPDGLPVEDGSCIPNLSGGTPSSAEVCDGIDNDGDGQTDEDLCYDGNPCTDDTCNPTDGTCSFLLNSAPCDDQNVCTAMDICSNGFCVGQPRTDLCDGKECGDDGCGGTCGQCEAFLACEGGLCVVDSSFSSLNASAGDTTVTLYSLDTAIVDDTLSWCMLRVEDSGSTVPVAEGDAVEVWVYEDNLVNDTTLFTTSFQADAAEALANRIDRTLDCSSGFGNESGSFELYAIAKVTKVACGAPCTPDSPTTSMLSVTAIIDDAREPDSQVADAKSLQTGMIADLVCRDEDWYMVHIDSPTDLIFEAFHRPSVGRLNVALFDSGLAPVGDVVDGFDSTSVKAQGLPAGDYYIVVSPATALNFNFYDAVLQTVGSLG